MGRTSRKRAKANLADRSHHLCFYCRRSLLEAPPRERTVDHVVTRAEGGGYSTSNLVYACSRDNNERGDTPFLDYVEVVASRLPPAEAESLRLRARDLYAAARAGETEAARATRLLVEDPAVVELPDRLRGLGLEEWIRLSEEDAALVAAEYERTRSSCASPARSIGAWAGVSAGAVRLVVRRSTRPALAPSGGPLSATLTVEGVEVTRTPTAGASR